MIPDSPITREEMYLDEIARGGGLPPVGPTDKDKYLHTNAITGEKEWSEIEQSGERVEIVLTAQYNPSTGKTAYVNSEYTFQDVYDMLAAKKNVVLLWGGGGNYLYATKYSQSAYGTHNIDLDFIGLFRYPVPDGYEIDACVAYASSVLPTDTLKFNGDTYLALYAPGATVQLVQDGSNLVAQTGLDNLKADTKYYIATNTGAGVTSRRWFSTVSYYFSLMGYSYEIIIKDELTGDLYRGTSTTFSPYTP